MKFLADHNLTDQIVTGLRRKNPEIDILRAREVDLEASPDPELLAWAAAEGRLLVTLDRATIPRFVAEGLERGDPMPGVFVIRPHVGVATVIEELLLIDGGSTHEDWVAQVTYLPL